MTTVTGDYSINFNGLPDESPWVDSGWENQSNAWQINTNGLRPSSFSTITVAVLVGLTWESTIASKIEIITNAAAFSDIVSPAIMLETPSGSNWDGYVLECNGTGLAISRWDDGVRSGLISTTLGSVSDGDTFELRLDTTNGSLTAYHNGSIVEALSVTDTTYDTGLTAGIHGYADNNNGRRIGSMAADGLAASEITGTGSLEASIAEVSGVGVVGHPGILIEDIYLPNAPDTLVGNVSDVAYFVYDKFPDGTETLLDSGTVNIVDSDFQIEGAVLGPIGETRLVGFMWPDGDNLISYLNSADVINLSA